jgi:hypothetical protein
MLYLLPLPDDNWLTQRRILVILIVVVIATEEV